MRLLTVRQPWAEAIVSRGKDVENRSRNLAGSYHGLVAIHAAKNTDWLNWDYANRHGLIPRNTIDESTLEYGAIVGYATLDHVHKNCKPNCSEWADPSQYHLVLTGQRALRRPISYRGSQALARLPEDVITRVLAAAVR